MIIIRIRIIIVKNYNIQFEAFTPSSNYCDIEKKIFKNGLN